MKKSFKREFFDFARCAPGAVFVQRALKPPRF
jgi:hypothetical protein